VGAERRVSGLQNRRTGGVTDFAKKKTELAAAGVK
jgi:hypothetical protein